MEVILLIMKNKDFNLANNLYISLMTLVTSVIHLDEALAVSCSSYGEVSPHPIFVLDDGDKAQQFNVYDTCIDFRSPCA